MLSNCYQNYLSHRFVHTHCKVVVSHRCHITMLSIDYPITVGGFHKMFLKLRLLLLHQGKDMLVHLTSCRAVFHDSEKF